VSGRNTVNSKQKTENSKQTGTRLLQKLEWENIRNDSHFGGPQDKLSGLVALIKTLK